MSLARLLETHRPYVIILQKMMGEGQKLIDFFDFFFEGMDFYQLMQGVTWGRSLFGGKIYSLT
jgi:hypothetical protein